MRAFCNTRSYSHMEKKMHNTKINEIEKKITDHDHDKLLLLKNLTSQHQIILQQD